MSFIIYVVLVAFLVYQLKPIMNSFFNGSFTHRSIGDKMTVIVMGIASFVVAQLSYQALSALVGSAFLTIVVYTAFLVLMFFGRQAITIMLASNNEELDEISWLRITKVDYSISYEDNLKNRDFLDSIYFAVVLWPVVLILWVYTKIQHKF